MTEMSHEDRLAGAPLDAVDGLIVRAIKDVYTTADAMPAGLTDRIKFATTFRALEAEVASLLREPAGLTTSRAEATGVETITFTSRHLTVMVSVAEVGPEHVRIDGWVTGGGVRVELRTDEPVRATTADADGRFVFDRVPRGTAQFVLHRVLPDGGEEPPVITPAVVL